MAIAVYVSFIKVGICRIVLTHRTSCSGVRACVTARSKGNGWGWAWKMKQEMIKMSRPIPHKTAMTGCRFIVLSLFSPLRVVATVGVCVPSGFVALYMAFFSSSDDALSVFCFVYQACWFCVDFSSNLFAYHLFNLSSVHRYSKMSRGRQSAPVR